MTFVSTDRVLPDYAGGSIINLVSSLAGHFGLETGVARLHAPLEEKLGLDGVQSVVLVIVDALGNGQLEKHMADGDMPNVKALLEHGAERFALTSVFPSTTMAAVTSMHICATPAQTGWLGYTLWLPEVGHVVEMIDQFDLETGRQLADRAFLKRLPSLSSRLDPLNITCRCVQPTKYRGSFLNDWYFEGAVQGGYVSANTAPTGTLRALRGSGKEYVVVYWPDYDTVCHRHGPSSPEASDEASAVDNALGRLVRGLPRDGKTLVIITADHGQHDLSENQVVYLEDDPALPWLLDGPPAGDRVCRTFRVKDGQLEAARTHLARYGEVVESSRAWAEGWFGGPPAQESFRKRVGDLIVLPPDGVQLIWSFGARLRPHLGSHGGLKSAEMMVPVIALRL
jgi:hypothetical protein